MARTFNPALTGGLDRSIMAARGVHLAPGLELMRCLYDTNGNVITRQRGERTILEVDYDGLNRGFAADSGLEVSSGLPVQYFCYMDPNAVTALFAATTSTKLLNERHAGSFADESVVVTVEDMAGATQPYNDYSDNGSADVSYSFPTRQIYRFQTSITYGDLEVQRAQNARITLASRKQMAASEIMRREHNRINLRGVAGYKLYGLLNDPNQDPPLAAAAADVNGRQVTAWSEKVKDTEHGASYIYNDIMTLWNRIVGSCGGLVDPSSPITLACSEKVQSYLNAVNTYNVSVMTLLKNHFPSITFVTVPELSMAEGERLYIISNDTLDGTGAGYYAYAEKLRMLPVQQHSSYVTQKFSAATYGCIITRPNLIASMTGI